MQFIMSQGCVFLKATRNPFDAFLETHDPVMSSANIGFAPALHPGVFFIQLQRVNGLSSPSHRETSGE